MTMVISGDNGVTFPNSSIQASAGSVLQVQSFTTNSAITTTSSTPVSTAITVSITPKFSTSKILAIVNIGATSSTGGSMQFTLNRAGTNIALGTGGTYNVTSLVTQNGMSSASAFNAGFSYLDSPATTSSTAYTVYFSTETGTACINKRQTDNFCNTVSTITVMEIAQ